MIFYEIDDVDYYCQRCDSAMVATDCDSPYCNHQWCMNCEQGCDIEWDDGICAQVAHTLDYETYHINADGHVRPIRTIYAVKGVL